MMKWWWVGDAERKYKSHCFPEILKDRVVANLEKRGMTFPGPGEFCSLRTFTDGFILDEGGMCFGDEPEMEYEVDDLKIFIPVTQVESWLDYLYSAKQRYEIGVPYYKVHTWLHCLCLTPEQYMELIERIETRLERAKSLTKAFDEKIDQRLRDAKKKRLDTKGRPTIKKLVGVGGS